MQPDRPAGGSVVSKRAAWRHSWALSRIRPHRLRVDAYYRSCGVCARRFLVCRPCGFNQHYCSGACAHQARAASITAAQVKYRASPEGRAQHREEQREYRARKRAPRVGDHLSPVAVEERKVPTVKCEPAHAVVLGTGGDVVVARPTAMDVACGEGVLPRAAVPGTGGDVLAARRAATSRPAYGKSATWTLLVVPELVAEAQRLLESTQPLSCTCCGRTAQVGRVVLRRSSPWVLNRREALRARLERR